ncbi:MAG: hypothetical protein HQ518_21870 [Rhodopirellula sp.]|nr:hypothetical protein [Rhodopirellula sp.]
MKLPEFRKLPRGPRAFDCYEHHTPIPSPLGEFTLELQMDVDDTTPGQSMIDMAQDLASQFTADVERVTELLFAQYQLASEDPDWLGECGLPPGLSAGQLAPYLHVRALAVSHDKNDQVEPYSARVYICPQWDEEHGLYFKRDSDGWIQVDC